MLLIRDAQMRVLSLALFERWMQGHLRECFPDRCAQLETTDLCRFVHCGLEKARSYCFVDEADGCRFVDLMVVLGPDFDVNPQLPWASVILKNPAFPDPSTRMEALFEAACEHLHRIEHPEEYATDDEPEEPEDEEGDDAEATE